MPAACLNLSNTTKPMVMGVLNITPDSFYAASRYLQPHQALDKASQMVTEGAAIIDIGGEATNPFGKQPISVQQELDRVIPVIELLRSRLDIPISIDTSQPQVMLAAVQAGANMINDVRALRLPGALEAAVQAKVPVCLMHKRYLGRDEVQRESPIDNIMDTLIAFFDNLITHYTQAGLLHEHIIIDPGIGAGRFGKDLRQNLQILQGLRRLKTFNYPILVGVSRKIFIGELLDAVPEDRLAGSLAATAIAIYNGATIIRSHDVKATVDAVKLSSAVLNI
jgi:dihydropteroate synthase